MVKKKDREKIIPNEASYDGLVIFDSAIKILDDEQKPIFIYGLLFNKEQKHHDDLWQWELNRFLAYLMGCEKVQENQGKLAPEMWVLSNGNSINLKLEQKNLIYRLMKEQLMGYRIKEFIEPFADIKESETEREFVISESFIERYGYEIMSFDTLMNEKRNEKID